MKVRDVVLAAALTTLGFPGPLQARDGGRDLDKCEPITGPMMVTMKPDSPLVHVITLYALWGCKRMEIEGAVSKPRVTIAKGRLMTRRELGELVRSLAQKARLSLEEDDRRVLLRPQ